MKKLMFSLKSHARRALTRFAATLMNWSRFFFSISNTSEMTSCGTEFCSRSASLCARISFSCGSLPRLGKVPTKGRCAFVACIVSKSLLFFSQAASLVPFWFTTSETVTRTRKVVVASSSGQDRRSTRRIVTPSKCVGQPTNCPSSSSLSSSLLGTSSISVLGTGELCNGAISCCAGLVGVFGAELVCRRAPSFFAFNCSQNLAASLGSSGTATSPKGFQCNASLTFASALSSSARRSASSLCRRCSNLSFIQSRFRCRKCSDCLLPVSGSIKSRSMPLPAHQESRSIQRSCRSISYINSDGCFLSKSSMTVIGFPRRATSSLELSPKPTFFCICWRKPSSKTLSSISCWSGMSTIKKIMLLSTHSGFVSFSTVGVRHEVEPKLILT
mmetsp:Transcript_24056/g.69576  ORF Transcript_24056/g.69576 Transcript_24056/m.69576 type:complete len:387 (+) Transcript_24056:1486-2646(+)